MRARFLIRFSEAIRVLSRAPQDLIRGPLAVGITAVLAGLAPARADDAAPAAEPVEPAAEIRAPSAPPQRIELVDHLAVAPDGSCVAFSWQGDIWMAPAEGGEARPVAEHPAREVQPAFSPDGRELAFLSNRDDTWQIYTVPIEGGAPAQRTWITESRSLLEYNPDGSRFLIQGWRDARGPNPARIYTCPRETRGPERMVFDDYANQATLSPDGKRMLFVREGLDELRQGYRGSAAGQIWMYDIETRQVTLLVDRATGGTRPMWKSDGSGFYYLDGRSGVFNVWEYDGATGVSRARTAMNGGNVYGPALSRDGRVMVFQHLFDVYRLDVSDPDAVPRRLDLISRRELVSRELQRRSMTKVWNQSDFGTLDWTRDGLELVFTAGGDVWVMDTLMRDPRAVTKGSAEYDVEAVFAPNGEAIYFLRDTGVGVNVWRARREKPSQHWWQGGLLGSWRQTESEGMTPWWQNESFVLEPLTHDRESRKGLQVSPDGSRLAWMSERGPITVHDLSTGRSREVGRGTRPLALAWSPDSQWLAAEIRDDDDNHDIWILSATGAAPPYNLSRNPSWDGGPAWSPDGRVLAFSGRTYDGVTDLYYVWLARDEEGLNTWDRTLEQALEKMSTRADAGNSASTAKAVPAKTETVRVRIDFERLAERVRRVRVSGSPTQLAWNPGSTRIFFTIEDASPKGTHALEFPVDERRPRFAKVSDQTGRGLRVGASDELRWMLDGVPARGGESLPFTAYQEFDQADYQRLAFRMIWRAMRDHFYDERMNNLDWDAVLLKYEDAAARAVFPHGFARVTDMLLGELNASHMGFTPERRNEYSSGNWRVYTAHLGLWFDPDWTGEGWRVSGVVRDGPTDTVRSRVEPGEVVRRINGLRVSPDMDPALALNGRLPRAMHLEVADAKGRTREVVVHAVSYEKIRELIRQQWIDESRARVSAASTNTLGYVNIQAMNWPSLRQFEKEIFAEGVGKDGLIIDVRNNYGGFISDFLLAILCHPHHALTIMRGGGEGYPTGYLGKVIWTKPIVVLCNQNSTSNAEIFSHAIKALGRGKLVGVPTQGSVISTPEEKILDLGTLRVPDRGWFSIVDGEDMERHGVVPDYYLWPVPGELSAGRDAQLEKAVEVLVREVAAERQRPRPPVTHASRRPAEQP